MDKLTKFSLDPIVLRLVWAKHWQVDSDWHLAKPLRRPEVTVWYVERGCLGVRLVNGECSFGPGMLVIVPSGHATAVRRSGGEQLSFFSMGSELSGPDGSEVVVSREPKAINGPMPASWLALWTEIIAAAERAKRSGNVSDSLTVVGRLYLWWAELIEYVGLAPQPSDACNDRRVSQALDFMQRNLHRSPSLTEVAEMVWLSPSHLRELFRSSLGRSFRACLTEMRMRQAKRLLSEGTLAIADIARQVGYSDVHHFSRAFSRHEHTTPTRYRDWAKRGLR